MLPELELRVVIKVMCRRDGDRRAPFPLTSVAVVVYTRRGIAARQQSDVATHQISIELTLGSAEEFEGHYQEDDADAAPSESSTGPDVPGAREKACVDRIPIPEHLAAMFVLVL